MCKLHRNGQLGFRRVVKPSLTFSPFLSHPLFFSLCLSFSPFLSPSPSSYTSLFLSLPSPSLTYNLSLQLSLSFSLSPPLPSLLSPLFFISLSQQARKVGESAGREKGFLRSVLARNSILTGFLWSPFRNSHSLIKQSCNDMQMTQS